MLQGNLIPENRNIPVLRNIGSFISEKTESHTPA